MSSDTHLSVVIPAYNEEKRIGETLERVCGFLKAQSYASEIIVVDDGSTDHTSEIAEIKLLGSPHQILKNEENRGKGFSVKRGVLAARGRFILFSDADLSTPIEEIDRCLPYLESGMDAVIGSRGLSGSNVEVRQNIMRQGMGKIFNRLARLFTFHTIQDSQCGFKCFRRRAARNLFRLQKIEGFSFDVEIIYLAQQKGYRLIELPVTWRNSPHSRVHVLKDSTKMFLDLVRIRWIHRRDS